MTGRYEIGPFRLDRQAGVLTRDVNPVPLGSRGVAVLAALVDRAGEFVAKRALIEAAWPDRVVEENNLAVQVAAIRRVLAQAGGEAWIENLPRRGYRFAGPAREIPEHSQAAETNRGRATVPRPLTSFVGRANERRMLTQLVANRGLVTLVGVGGIGKTRLALEIASDRLAAHPDGVLWVDLAPLDDPSLVARSLAQALDVRAPAEAPLTELICRQLRYRDLLVVLDNCERLAVECGALAEAVLRECPRTTIVATSREPLRTAGEQIFPVPPLTLPEPGAEPVAIAASDAVRLFIECAKRHQPGFELTARRAPVVASLCMRLDGIPLALELAAARVRAVSIEQIFARIDDRFRLLTSDEPGAIPRHRTLRAMLDWSFDLLSEGERSVLRRLAVFAGEWTLEAASAVVSDGESDEYAVLDVHSRLVQRSLIVADTSSISTRYRLLETVRAYATELLEESDETAVRRDRHAAYFLRFFERAEDDWLRMRRTDWIDHYSPELVNLRAALDWALGRGDHAALAIRLAGAAGGLWVEFGLYDECASTMKSALRRVDGRTPDAEHARLWQWLGWSNDHAPAEARDALEHAARLYRAIGDWRSLGTVLATLGRYVAVLGDAERGEDILAEAKLLLDRAGPPLLLGTFHFNYAFLKTFTGDLAAARRHYELALQIEREAGNERLALQILGNLGNVHWALGGLEAAAHALREQVSRLRLSSFATRFLLGWNLCNLAGVLTEQGELNEALDALHEGLPLIAEYGFLWVFSDHAALLVARFGNIEQAARLAGYSDARWRVKQATRQPQEANAHLRLHTMLRDELSDAGRERLLAEGAAMSDEYACAHALAIDPKECAGPGAQPLER